MSNVTRGKRRMVMTTPPLDEIGEVDPPLPSQNDLVDIPLLEETDANPYTHSGLTPQDELMCQFYLERFDVEYAAMRANVPIKEAKKRLRLPSVQKYCRELSKVRAERFNISQDKILAELARITFADPREIAEWDENGIRLKNSSFIPEHAARSIQGLSISLSESVTESGGSKSSSVNFKFYDKLKAIELLGKHLSMFTEKVEVQGSLRLEDLLTYTKDVPKTIEGERSETNLIPATDQIERDKTPPETPEDALIRALNAQLSDLDKEENG